MEPFWHHTLIRPQQYSYDCNDNKEQASIVFWLFRNIGFLSCDSEESCEDMSCGEDSPWGSPQSDGEGAFFPSTLLRSKKWWGVVIK